MNSKSGLRVIIEDFFEDSLASSSLTKKMLQSISLIANETKKIADALITINDRLNQHEQVILKLVNMQVEKKDKQADYTLKPKEGPSKPN